MCATVYIKPVVRVCNRKNCSTVMCMYKMQLCITILRNRKNCSTVIFI